MSVRRLLPIHRWTALTLGLIALLSAVTGAGMAFREQLEPLVYPRIAPAACATPFSMDDVLASARMIHPEGNIDYVRVQNSPRAPVAVRYLDKDTLYLDRCTQQLIASQNRYGGVFGTLEWIHRGQWWPAAGGYVMGTGAAALLFLLLGIGLALWGPRKGRRLVDGFRLDRRLRKGPAFDMGLHRTVGAWVAIPLALSALTGLPNAFPALQEALTGKAQRAPRSTVRGPMLAIDAAWQRVQRVSPNPREVLIHVARKPSDPIEIFVIAADAPHANARTYLYLDAHDGHVLRYVPYARMGIGGKTYYWMLSLHTGEVGGVFGQLILFLGAVGALVLGFTGIRTWLRRRVRKRKPRVTAQPETTARPAQAR